MTVDPGVIVKFENNDTDLLINGTLVVDSSTMNPITFTSYRDDSSGGDTNDDGASDAYSGDWGGIVLGSTASKVVLRNARIAFGGSPAFGAADCAVRVVGSTPLIEGVTFDRNDNALCVFSNGCPDAGGGALGSKGNNRFIGYKVGGSTWALYNDSALDVYARNNAWGYATTAEIDAIIRDRKDSATAGTVYYDGFLMH